MPWAPGESWVEVSAQPSRRLGLWAMNGRGGSRAPITSGARRRWRGSRIRPSAAVVCTAAQRMVKKVDTCSRGHGGRCLSVVELSRTHTVGLGFGRRDRHCGGRGCAAQRRDWAHEAPSCMTSSSPTSRESGQSSPLQNALISSRAFFISAHHLICSPSEQFLVFTPAHSSSISSGVAPVSEFQQSRAAHQPHAQTPTETAAAPHFPGLLV
ncbi:hypothetical protein P153DRAFT_388660 [Dothidotthia symphoricarpi CBS 119687]|uniref:Uncharacterized protein n=1 Tax=Dothidotthia symphoricarpi CBS 119687 TaxID=1392245 RepID=A0A6A6A766_9PLEO|nr:uncharacterized protein P153DRAFT_388660 [Dothidotthia symphoricarpi CBS 119687]KAF2126628.1 hypothetical protein P153DRAFT_388660 [Dothidotthia symphoricarpi CBS 119687]